MGDAPRSPAPRSHFLARSVKPSGFHCTDAFGGTSYIYIYICVCICIHIYIYICITNTNTDTTNTK